MRKISVPKNCNKSGISINETSEIFSDKEKLWKYFFWSEYKPEVAINFQNIKWYIDKQKEENIYRKFRDYNYNMWSPEDLCEYFIQNNPWACTITFLESLSHNQKRCLADIFLELSNFSKIQEQLWTAMLFWIRHYGYYYSSKREEKLRDYLVNNTSLFGSKDDFNILERSFESQSRINSKSDRDIITTLLWFIIENNLQKDIAAENIKQYIIKELWSEFSLQKFTPRNNYSLGKAQGRYRKDVDKNWNLIEIEKINSVSKHIKEKINWIEEWLEVVNRTNNNIYSDRSGKIYKIYLDWPLSFGLFHRNEPIALISFSIKDPESIFINQIQTIPSENFDRHWRMISQSVNPVVNTINRQEVTYSVVNIIAPKYWFKNIIIQSWENNKWIKEYRKVLEYDDNKRQSTEKNTNIPHLSKDIAKKIYDNFAINHWFKKDKKTKDRQKKI